VGIFSDYITADFPLIGIEPSAILTFRDEYIRLADDTESAKNVFTIEEFFKNEITKGKIHAEQFSEEEKLLKFTDIATKVIEYHGSDFCDVECTEKQFGYYLQFGLLWNGRFFWI
jgi:hypothetical protein